MKGAVYRAVRVFTGATQGRRRCIQNRTKIHPVLCTKRQHAAIAELR